MKLLPHQQQFVNENPLQATLAWGTRVGKTYAIVGWLENYPHRRFLLVCPKRLKSQWEDEVCYMRNVTVLTKEEVKKADLSKYDGLVFDEAHHLASPLFTKPSQLTRTIYEWYTHNQNAPVLLATATPITSHPAALHTLATLTGNYVPWKEYRDKFYQLVRRPYRPQPFWEPKQGWQKDIQKLARKWCHIKTLSDVTDVPEQRHHRINITLTEDTKKRIANIHDEEPMQEWYDRHKMAQMEEKLDIIKDITKDTSKSIIVCKYKEQIEYYKRHLKDHYVLTLTGDTKDQGQVIKDAQDMVEGHFIIQADCGEGFRGDGFDVMVFASMSWRFVSYEQMLGRLLHLEKQRSNDIYYVLADDKDKLIYNRVVNESKDFSLAQITKRA